MVTRRLGWQRSERQRSGSRRAEIPWPKWRRLEWRRAEIRWIEWRRLEWRWLRLAALCAFASAAVLLAPLAGIGDMLPGCPGCGVFAAALPGQQPLREKEGETAVYAERGIEVWHYSGSYWNAIFDEGTERVLDRELAGSGIDERLSSEERSLRFEIAVPAEVREAVSSGGRITGIELIPKGLPLGELYSAESISRFSPEIEGGVISFSLSPRFVLSPFLYKDFVEGYRRPYALISKERGDDLYSLFGGGLSAAKGFGRFDAADPFRMTTPYLHPSMIEDSSGRLKPGYTIRADGTKRPSEGIQIGKDTFAGGGAIGYLFRFPAGLRISYVSMVPAEEQTPTGPAIVPVPGPSIPTRPAIEAGARVSSVQAALDAPGISYVGHPVHVFDESVFGFGEDFISAERAYREGLARGRISVQGGGVPVKSVGRTESVISFREPGEYAIRLDVSAGSMSDSVTSPIEVRKVPGVNAVLGGTQKQNRRQVLQIVTAQDPGAPLSSLRVEIRSLETGEVFAIGKEFASEGGVPGVAASAGGVPVMTENIKGRVLKDIGSDEYFAAFELEFLTKLGETSDFEYTVSAVDSAGRAGSASGRFTVLRDDAPEARIGMSERCYRAQGGGAAIIVLEDLSAGDGDALERIWHADPDAEDGREEYVPLSALPGYRDLSLGSGQRVSFEKVGVGRFSVRLSVREKWSGDTLPEFVSDADRRSSAASAAGIVDNIAPVVSAGVGRLPQADVLLIAEDAAGHEAAQAVIPALKAALLEKGISAEPCAELAAHPYEEEEGRIVKLGTVNDYVLPGGSGPRYIYAHLASDFWGVTGGMDRRLMGSQDCSAADAHRYYVMTSAARLSLTESSSVSYYERCYPLTLTAREISVSGGSLKPAWSTVITRGLFDSPTMFADARFAHDEQGRYLYLISDGKTLVIEKSGGAAVGTLKGELGLCNHVLGSNVYTVRKDGVCRASLEDGSVSLLRRLDVLYGAGCAQLVRGKLVFAVRDGEGISRCSFDPRSETLDIKHLEASAHSAGLLGLIGTDFRGRIAAIYEDGSLRWWDEDGTSGAISPRISGRIESYAPARDSSGRIDRVTALSYKRGKDSYNCYLNCYDLESGRFGSISSSSASREPLDPDRISYSVSLRGAERILFSSGSFYENEVWPGMGTTKPKSFTVDASLMKAVAGEGRLLTNGVSAGHSAGFTDGGIVCMSTAFRSGTVHQITAVTETGEDETARLIAKHLGGSDMSFCFRVKGGFDVQELASHIASMAGRGRSDSPRAEVRMDDPRAEGRMDDPAPAGSLSGEGFELLYADVSLAAEENAAASERVFARGEYVSYDIRYSDWENDPSKQSFWLYEHEALNDGVHPQSGELLSAPIRRFYQDGRYTLRHWQTDDAGRGRTDEFDKASEPAVISFLIRGSAAGQPRIESMATDPAAVEEGDDYDIKLRVSDTSGAELRLVLTLRRNGELVKTFARSGIAPDASGDYPELRLSGAPKARPGVYEAEARLYSADAADIAVCSFVVVQKRSVRGEVSHTEEWDANRRRYNLARCGSEGAHVLSGFAEYRALSIPRLRGENVFWPGERLMLSALIGGEPIYVSAELEGCGVSSRLRSTGETDGDEKAVYEGVLWDESLVSKLCGNGAEERRVRFTAVYEDESLSYTVPVIFDDEEGGYWQIRREY